MLTFEVSRDAILATFEAKLDQMLTLEVSRDAILATFEAKSLTFED